MAADPHPLRHLNYAWLWLAAILLPLGAVKLITAPGSGPYGLDACYYFQIARHVARGEGLLTSVSLYHQGWPLPAPAHIYPLWPLLLGYAGRLFGLVQAASVLPKLFYVIDLVLLYLLAARVAASAGRLWIWHRLPGLNVGHLLVALFGTNPLFFSATTHPYTEGLAFGLAFASVLALGRYATTARPWWSAIAAAFGALSFLARTQFVGIAMGSFVVLVIAGARDRPFRPGALLYAVVAISIVTPSLFFGHIPGIELIGIDRPPRVDLPPFHHWVQTESWIGFVVDRSRGLMVAFDAGSSYSYIRSFGLAALLVPVAVAHWMGTRARRGRILSLDASTLLPYATALIGAFFFVSLLFFHGRYFMPWFFGWRHGLPFVFSLMLAIAYLLDQQSRWLTVAAHALVVASIATGLLELPSVVAQTAGRGLSSGERELVTWLDTTARQPPTVLTTHAHALSVFSDANFHWTECHTPPETTRVMLQKLPIDYVVVYEEEARCPFLERLANIQVAKVFGEPGRRVYVLAPRRGAARTDRDDKQPAR